MKVHTPGSWLAVALLGLLAASAPVPAAAQQPGVHEAGAEDDAAGDDADAGDDDWDTEEGDEVSADDAYDLGGGEDETGDAEPIEDEDETVEPTPARGEDEEPDEEPEELPGGTTARLRPLDAPPSPEDSRFLLPPFMMERRGDVRTTALFPFFWEREAPGDSQIVAGPYYRRRSTDLNADVVFPFVWSFRTPDSFTWAVPPVYSHRDEDGYDWGAAPFVFHGRSEDETYTVIPPLLTGSWADEDEAYTFAGPFWRVRSGDNVNWGVFPLLWTRQGDIASHLIAAPFLFRFVDEEDRTVLTVVPPVYHRITPTSAAWGIAPLLLHNHDEGGTAWTVPPLLFHYSRYGQDVRLVTPLFGYFGVGGASTLITPLYQRHRGDTELDAVTPLFFSWRDPREAASALVIPPLVWHFDDPASTTTVVFPFFGRWRERGRYTTWATPLFGHYQSQETDSAGTWIFPSFQFSHTPTSASFNVHPLVYSTSARTHRHLVLAPVYWDFEDYEDDSRATVLFPLFWRFRNGASVTQLAGNTFYRHWRERGEPGWEFHFFPLFAFGVPRPGDHWWSVLYGLAGYRRQGRYARASALWIPFQVDGPAEP